MSPSCQHTKSKGEIEHQTADVWESVATARRNRGEVKGFKVRLGYVPFFPDGAEPATVV